jgi:hypothetical protein
VARGIAYDCVLCAVIAWWSLFRGLCLLFLLSNWGFAQPLPQWPRHPTSGRIECRGVLPWPSPTLTLAKQKALVRHWYTAKLTQASQQEQAQLAKEGVTFAGVPLLAYADFVFYAPDSTGTIDSVYRHVLWRLLYHVSLVPTAAGLRYHLSEFERIEGVFDASSSDPLEKVLVQYAAEQGVFYRRLRKALAGW